MFTKVTNIQERSELLQKKQVPEIFNGLHKNKTSNNSDIMY